MDLQIINAIIIFRSAHIITSGAFLITAIWLIIRSARGVIKNLPYTTLDKFLSYTFIVLLYLQLVFGLLIFAGPVYTDNYGVNTEGALKLVSKRFWPIEHIIFMLFALFIANVGLIFSNQAPESKEKHKKTLIYYAIAVIMIALSIIAVYLP